MAAARTLLLVEDDETTREVLTLLLTSDGWNIDTSPDGEAALEALAKRASAPDVVLMDQHLPGLQGEALASHMRRLFGEHADAPVLIGMSASVMEPIEELDGLLLKPFGAADLNAMYEQAASRSPRREKAGGQREERNPAAVPALDMDTVLNLQQQMGARARELYRFALADANDRIDRMEAALGAAGTANFQQEAHALKGSCGMIGARRLARLAEQAERVESFQYSDFPPHQLLSEMRTAWKEIHLMLETLFPL